MGDWNDVVFCSQVDPAAVRGLRAQARCGVDADGGGPSDAARRHARHPGLAGLAVQSYEGELIFSSLTVSLYELCVFSGFTHDRHGAALLRRAQRSHTRARRAPLRPTRVSTETQHFKRRGLCQQAVMARGPPSREAPILRVAVHALG